MINKDSGQARITPIVISPTAQFTANTTQGKAPLTVQFTDQSVSAGTTSYKWNINNDGVVDYTTPSPSHTYRSAGVYTVNLTVTDSSGSDSGVKTNFITVIAAPGINATASKIGTYNNGVWYLDFNTNGIFDTGTDKQYNFGQPGFTPVVGDWNGDGRTKIGVYKDGASYLDYLGEGTWTTNTKVYSFGAPGSTQFVGDWNGDGRTKIGVYKDGAWYLDYLGNGTWTTTTKAYSFGATGFTPLVGKWS